MFGQLYCTNTANCKIRLEVDLEKHLEELGCYARKCASRERKKKLSGFLAMCLKIEKLVGRNTK